MPEKPMTQERKKEEIAKKTVAYLAQLSREYGYPLSRSNWRGLEIQIGIEVRPHFEAGDAAHLKQTAEKTGVDFGAVAAALHAWRVKEDLVNVTDVMDRYDMLFSEVYAGQELGYLDVVYPPAEAKIAADKYLPSLYQFNYPCIQVGDLTDAHFQAMRANATIAKSQAREYLELDYKDLRQFIFNLPPVGTVPGLRGNGMEIFRTSDIRRLKEQLWSGNPSYRAAVEAYRKSKTAGGASDADHG